MSKASSITARLSSSLELSIIATGPGHNLEDPLWAINWFDLKRGWLYDLYNKLAVRHVLRVGGRPVLKAQLTKRIVGTEEDTRHMLLIVRYPSAGQFLKMVQSKIFQLKSILRVNAVRNFTFGFMTSLDEPKVMASREDGYKGKLIYLVHHFRRENGGVYEESLKNLATSLDVFTIFMGTKCALIGRKRNNGKLRTAPFLMDGLVVFAAFEESQCEALVDSSEYQDFANGNKSNFIGWFSAKT